MIDHQEIIIISLEYHPSSSHNIHTPHTITARLNTNNVNTHRRHRGDCKVSTERKFNFTTFYCLKAARNSISSVDTTTHLQIKKLGPAGGTFHSHKRNIKIDEQ